MPAIFVLAFVAFLVLVALFVVVMVVVFRARPSRHSDVDFPPSGGGDWPSPGQ